MFFLSAGRPTLVTDHGARELAPEMCVGFKAGSGIAHHLVNRSDADVFLIEVKGNGIYRTFHQPDFGR